MVKLYGFHTGFFKDKLKVHFRNKYTVKENKPIDWM